jgi:hypothetical protein
MEKTKSEVDKIKDILADRYIAKDLKEIREKNKDVHGISFNMNRKIVLGSVKEYIIYQFDTSASDKSDIFPFFKSKPGLKRICDYCIFVEDNKRFFVFLVELKKGKKSPIPQLEASECFINFILESAKRLGMKFDKKPNIRKLGITDDNVSDKRTTDSHTYLEFDKNKYLQIQSNLYLSRFMKFPVNLG